MIVAIHQPHFMPALAYLELVRRADLFVLLDDVPCETGRCQNRARIKTGAGPAWLEVPLKRVRGVPISEMPIDNDPDGRPRWGRRLYEALRESYGGAPYFGRYADELQDVLDARWERLGDLDRRLIDFLMSALGIRKPVLPSSKLRTGSGAHGWGLLELCQAVGADSLLDGVEGCAACLNGATPSFTRAGIQVLRPDFGHPRYRQLPDPERFVPGLSAADLLFNCGPAASGLLRERERSYAH